MKIPRVGMRNIKTTIAVFLCLLVFELINRENPLLACVAAVICMKPDVDNSLKAGISRIIGTTIGGLISVIFLLIIEANIIEKLYIFLIPIGIILLIEICVAIDRKDSVQICCIVYLSIMITKRSGGDFVLYPINRIIDTSIGILIALALNRFLIFPTWLKKFKVVENLQQKFNIKRNEDF